MKAKRITVNALYKMLGDAIADGHGRLPVCVDRDSLDTGNRTWNHCAVEGVKVIALNVCDGDGFHIENRDGSERMRRECVLYGGLGETK